MHLGAVTYNVLKDWDLDTILSRLSALGYEAVELRTGHAHGVEPSLDDNAREAVHGKFAHSKLRLLSYGTTCEFQSPDPVIRRKNVEEGKRWIGLAHDTGALAIKVRPNGLPKEVPREQTIQNIGEALRELGDYGSQKGIEIWMEVHGQDTQNPPVSAAIMKAANHRNVGACWNSNPTDVVNGSVQASFHLLSPFIRNCHINELTNDYPWRELFSLLRKSGYQRYTLCEAAESKEPERFLRFYRSLWTELNREC
jgi:sugar phosphate isomerase/epimerase